MSRTVREIGEFGLIAALSDALPPAVRSVERLAIGIGDDAAVWSNSPDASLVITTDTIVEEVHFRLDWTDWRSLGHKMLAVNISDIAAMGATPTLAVVSLGLRGTELVAELEDLYRGAGELAERFRVTIAGGDVVASPNAFTLHVTLLGEAPGSRVLTRGGAKPGDLIGVSGTLGAAAAGLRLLAGDENRRRAQTADHLIAAHLRPEPRVALGQLLLEHGATAAMDLSDGLFGDLPKILDASKASAIVDADRIPVAAAVRALFPNDWFDLATRGGEDYELLFTAPPGLWDDLARQAGHIGSTISRIGAIHPQDSAPILQLRTPEGTVKQVKPGAFDHFQ